MQRRLKNTNPVASAVIGSLRRCIGYEFGPLSRVPKGLRVPFLLWTAGREEKRLAAGVRYEPDPVVDHRNLGPDGGKAGDA